MPCKGKTGRGIPEDLFAGDSDRNLVALSCCALSGLGRFGSLVGPQGVALG